MADTRKAGTEGRGSDDGRHTQDGHDLWCHFEKLDLSFPMDKS